MPHAPVSSRTVILVTLLLLLPFLWLARYAHPYADDLSYAAHSEGALLPRLWQEYQGWNGRISSNILVLRGPVKTGVVDTLLAYRWMPVGWTVGLLVAWYLLLGASAFGSLTSGQRIIGASSVTLLWFNIMPDITEGLYWYTGAATYTAGSCALILAWRGWLLLVEGRSGVWSVVAGSLLASLWALFSSEVHLVLVVLSMMFLLVWLWHKGRLGFPVVICAVVVLAAAAVMIGAPGNAVRSAHFPERGRMGLTVFMASAQTLRFVVEWITTPALAVLSVVWYRVSDRFTSIPLARVTPMVPLLAGLLLTGVLMALPYWTTGMLGQHRTVNVACLFFLPCWALFLLSLRGRKPVRSSFGPPIQVLMLLLLVALSCGGNGGRVVDDLVSGSARSNDEVLCMRYRAVLDVRSAGGSVLLAEQPHCTKALRIPDPVPDPAHWVNRSMARLLDRDHVRIIGPETNACDAFKGGR
jgi:hypothetical protein